MKTRHFILLVILGGLLLLPPFAGSAVQRATLPFTEALMPAGIFRLPANESNKFVVLTIDDAPSSRTDELLALLEAYHAQATFFVHTDQITDENRSFLEAAIVAGHELGNHLPADQPAWKMTKDEFSAAFELSHQELASFGEGVHSYFRPPQGLYRTGKMDEALVTFGYNRPLAALGSDRRYVLASFIPWDAGGEKTNTDDPELNTMRARKYAKQLADNIYPGAIVIFHDGEAGGREARLAATMVSLEAFLMTMQEAGYEIVPLSKGIRRISPPE